MDSRSRAGFRRVVASIIDVTGLVAGFATVAFVLLNTQEVVRRYVLRAPTEWGFEIGRWLLIPVAFLALAAVTKARRHITFDMLYLRFPLRLKTAMDVAHSAIILIFAALLSWEFVKIAREYYTTKHTSGTTPDIPLYPLVLIAFVGTALLSVQAATDIWDTIRTGPRGRREPGPPLH